MDHYFAAQPSPATVTFPAATKRRIVSIVASICCLATVAAVGVAIKTDEMSKAEKEYSSKAIAIPPIIGNAFGTMKLHHTSSRVGKPIIANLEVPKRPRGPNPPIRLSPLQCHQPTTGQHAAQPPHCTQQAELDMATITLDQKFLNALNDLKIDSNDPLDTETQHNAFEFFDEYGFYLIWKADLPKDNPMPSHIQLYPIPELLEQLGYPKKKTERFTELFRQYYLNRCDLGRFGYDRALCGLIARDLFAIQKDHVPVTELKWFSFDEMDFDPEFLSDLEQLPVHFDEEYADEQFFDFFQQHAYSLAWEVELPSERPLPDYIQVYPISKMLTEMNFSKNMLTRFISAFRQYSEQKCQHNNNNGKICEALRSETEPQLYVVYQEYSPLEHSK